LRDFGLKDQIRRAAVSVASNIAEGFERGGNAEFRQFLANAKGSCAEVKTQLYIALDAEYLSNAEFDFAYALTNEISKLVGGFMTYLADTKLRGSKFTTSSERNKTPPTANPTL
jgi:four helix bundle protein